MSQGTQSVWILGDQLLRRHPALEAAQQNGSRDSIRVVLIQSQQRLRRLRYHGKKLVLLFSAMQHYAERLRAQGFEVEYIRAESMLAGLRRHIEHHQSNHLITMEATEYAGRAWQHERLEDVLSIPVTVLPNLQFLISQYNPNPDPEPYRRYIMEQFYRAMRRHFGVLMDGDQPLGGEWNYDKLNRQPLPANATPPWPVHFEPDELTRQVMEEIKSGVAFTGEIGRFDLATTHEEAATALEDFIRHRLNDFGPYEDAMSSQNGLLYHSGLSPYLNIGLLEPMQLIRAAEAAYHAGHAPINSVEGFIRQILGWREFMMWQYWRQMPAMLRVNAWNALNPLPEFFWNGRTDMNCLRHVLQRIHLYGYAHHIERLMLLSNFCTLTGIQPLAVNNWFLSSFIDAYEWVMVPNVLGMGLNADGGITATKPYIASANYISKMSDYCAGCRFDTKARTGPDACPFNFLYWNFLLEHEETLRAHPRFGPSVLGLRHLDAAEREQVRQQAASFMADLTDIEPDESQQ